MGVVDFQFILTLRDNLQTRDPFEFYLMAKCTHIVL